MRLSSIVLLVSLAINAGLAAFYVLPSSHAERGASPASSLARSTGIANDAPRAGSSRSAPAAGHYFDTGGDLPLLLTRLREAGFPKDVIREIIRALVAGKFEAERARLNAASLKTPYWQEWTNSYMDPKTGPLLRKLYRDEMDLIQKLLGDTHSQQYADTEEGRAMREKEMGNIAPEKMDQLTAYAVGFADQRMKLFSGMANGVMLPADRVKLAALDKEFREGLTEFLSPAEAYEYNLRNSEAAMHLKWMLGPANPSEADFRTMFPLFQAYLDRFPNAMGPSGATTDPAQAIAKASMMAQLTSAVGEKRAEDLAIALDPKYSVLNQLVSRLNLPISTSKQVTDVKEAIEQRAATLRTDPAIAADERAKQLGTLAAEASAQLSTVLGGAENLNAYTENLGQWILSLSPPPKT